MTTSINTVLINCSSPLEQFEVTDLFYLSGPLLGANFLLTINTLSLTLVTFFLLGMIETISYIARTLSLGLQLTANMIGSLALIFLIFLLFIIFDSVNYTEFVIIYSFLPTFIYNTDNNSQDSQDVPNKETKVSAVIIYSNTEVNRSQILSDNKGSGGIYM